MNVAHRKTMTREEFFQWAEVQEERYEFDGERPVAMTGGTNAHGLVVANIVAELGTRLRGKSCQVLPAAGGGVATVGQTVHYSDATVTCSPVQGRDRLIPNPVVVFEVVSEGNARTDRFHKMREYHAVPSIRRYILVEQTVPVLLSYLRQDDAPWTATSLSIGDVLALPEIGIEIPVADIFEGVSFANPEAAPTRA